MKAKVDQNQPSLKELFSQEINTFDQYTPHLFFAQVTDFFKRLLKSILLSPAEYTFEEYLIKIEAKSILPVEYYEQLKVLALTIEHYRYGNNSNSPEMMEKIKKDLIDTAVKMIPYCDPYIFKVSSIVSKHKTKEKQTDIDEKVLEQDFLSTEQMIEKLLSTTNTNSDEKKISVSDVYHHITNFPLHKMHKFDFDDQELKRHIWDLHIKHGLLKGQTHDDIVKHYSAFGADPQHIKHIIKLNIGEIEKIKKIELGDHIIDLIVYVSLLALNEKTASQAREILLKKKFELADINLIIDEVYPRQYHSPKHHT